MKNKFIFGVGLCALISASFVSCKEKTDLDGICDNLAEEQLAGMHSGAAADGSVLKVAQLNFLKDGTIERTVMAVGDGVYEEPKTTVYASYRMGNYTDQNLGRQIHLYPKDGGDVLTVKMIRGGIEEDGQPVMGDKNDKVSEIPSLSENITEIPWYANDTSYFKVDTVIDVVVKDTFRHRVRDGKKYTYVIDSIVDRIVPTKMKYPIGPSLIRIRSLVLNRDAATLKNTGSYSFLTKAYEYDKKRVPSQTKDSLITIDFSWYFKSFTGASSFVIVALTEEGDEYQFDIKYDVKIPAITIEKQVLSIKAAEEENKEEDNNGEEENNGEENNGEENNGENDE